MCHGSCRAAEHPHPAGGRISSGDLSAYGIFGELSQWPAAPSPCVYILYSSSRVLVSCREASRDSGEWVVGPRYLALTLLRVGFGRLVVPRRRTRKPAKWGVSRGFPTVQLTQQTS